MAVASGENNSVRPENWAARKELAVFLAIRSCLDLGFLSLACRSDCQGT